MHTQTVPDSTYRTALSESSIEGLKLPPVGSKEEEALLAPIKALFSNYTHENLAQNVTEVYAEKVYFRDAFRHFDSAVEIRDYMLEGLKPLSQAEFVFNRVARSGPDFYLDWTMRLDFKKTPPNTWEESIGMTHIRFDQDGKVIFHQDYWDPTDIVYRRIPVAKQLIGYVKSKM